MAYTRVYPAGYVFLNAAGDGPAAAGTITFYDNGTTDLKTVYTTSSGTASSNPLTLGSDGRLPNDVYADQPLRVKLLSSAGAQIFQKDDVGVDSDAVQYLAPYSGSISRTSESKMAEVVSLTDFVAAASLDGVTDVLAALNSAVTAAANKSLLIPGNIYLSDDITIARTVHVILEGTVTMASSKRFVAHTLTDRKLRYQSGFGGVFDMRAFGGGPGQGSSVNITTALNLAMTHIETTIATASELHFPAGTYYFLSVPNDIDFKITISGAGQSNTDLRKYWQSASDTHGIFNVRTGGNSVVIKDLTITGDTGSQDGSNGTGCNISIIADATNSPSFCNLTRVTLTSAAVDTVKYQLYVDGTANETASPGVRALELTDVQCFGGQTRSVHLYGVVSPVCKFTQIASSGGTSGELLVDGTANVPSSSVQITASYIGNLSLGRVTIGTIIATNIAGSMVNTSNTTDVVVVGAVSGAVTSASNSTSSRWIDTCKQVTNTAVDATPTVKGTSLLTLTPSGSNTVTTFDDGVRGQEVLVIFGNGSTTIDFTGTNLKGNAGSDWSPASGDFMRMQFDGTNWYCAVGDATA